MRIKSGLLAFALLAAACGGSVGDADSTPSRVFHIGLFHVGLDHIPSSLPALVEALQAMGYMTAGEVATFEKGLESIPEELSLAATKSGWTGGICLMR